MTDDRAAFETAVEKALRRCSEADAKGEEYIAEFKEMLRSIVRGTVQIFEKQGLAPEVARDRATRAVLQMAGIEKGSKLLSPRMMTFPAHQQEWIVSHIQKFIEEIREGGKLE